MSKRNFDRNTTAMQAIEGIDLSDKTVLITGANSGIGLETARALAHAGAHVVMACRNLKSAEEGKSSILSANPNAKIDIIFMDASKLKTVEACAEEYIAKGWPLHIMILNAGVYNPVEKHTEDGFESTFQVNHLAHFYLVQLLATIILTSTPARLVHVSSVGHKNGALNPDKITKEVLSPLDPRKIPTALTTYSRSKFCNVVFSNELNRRLSDQGVTSNSLHPGAVRTEITRNTLFRHLFKLPFLLEPVVEVDKGAATSVYCATSPDLEGKGGLYFDACKQKAPNPKVNNPSAGTKLWELSEQMINEWKQRN